MGGVVVVNQLTAEIVNSDGYTSVMRDGYAIPAPASTVSVSGKDGSNVARTLRTLTDGTLRIDPTGATTQPVSGTVTANQGGTWNINDISGTITLPSGASTSAKQPALGTAGTASADVITIQGIGGMTAIKVDGSGFVQSVSQSGTWNIGTVTTITNVVHVDDNASSLTVDNTGTFVVQNQDGYGVKLTAQTGTPNATDTGLVVRNIPSGNQTVTQATGTNLHMVVDSGTVTTITNVVHVDDNAGSLTVDGIITANAGTGVFDITPVSPVANDYLPVRLTDGSSFYSAGGGSSTSTKLINNDGYRLETNDGYAFTSNNSALLVAGYNHNTNKVQIINVDVTGALKVDGSSFTQPVSGTVAATQSGTWNIGTVTTVTGITNVVHVDDNSGSITVDNGGTFAVQAAQSGTWNIRNQDGYGVLLTAQTGTPGATDTGLVVRNIPSGTQTVTGTITLGAGGAVIGHVIADSGSTTAVTGNVTVVQGTGTNLHTVIDSGTITTVSTLTSITNVVHVDDNAGSLTVDNNGTFIIQNQDGYGVKLTAQTGTPNATDTGLVVRNIPSGTQTVSGTIAATQSGTWNVGTVTTVTGITNVVHVDDNAGSLTVDNGGTFAVQAAQSGNWSTRTLDGYGNQISSSTSNPIGTETGLIVRNIPSGIQTVSGTVASTQSGTWNVRNQDGYGVVLTAQTGTPNATDTGLVVRNIPSGTQTVTGTVTLGAGSAVVGHVIADSGSTTAVTGNVTVVQGTGTNLHTVVDSGTITTITNVVHVDDNAGSLTVDNGGTFAVQATQAGTWNVQNLDGYGVKLTASSTTPIGTETALIVRNIPSGTQPVSGTVAATQSGTWNVGTVTSITNVVHVDDNAGSLTVDGTITANAGTGVFDITPVSPVANDYLPVRLTDGSAFYSASGSSSIKLINNDGYRLETSDGYAFTSNNSALLIAGYDHSTNKIRIPNVDGTGSLKTDGSSFTQPISGSVRNLDGYGVVLTASSGTPIGSETALIVRNIPSGTQAVSGTVAATQSGTWNVGTVTTITNVVHVDDNAGSLTVDGTITANAGTGVFDITPAVPAANDYLPVRLTDGSAFYTAGAGASVLSTKLINNDGYRLESSDGYAFTTNNSALLIAGYDHSTNKVRIINVDSVGSIKVDGSSFTQPVSGTVAATQSGTWNIATVTTVTGITNVVHVDDNAGSLTVDNAGTFVIQNQDGYGVKLTAQTTTPNATDTGLVVRNIPSGTQTVSGTVTANAGSGVFDITPVSPAANDYLPVRLTDGSAFYSATGSAGSGSTKLTNNDGYRLETSDGYAFTANNSALLIAGYDHSTNKVRIPNVDSTGSLKIDGSSFTQPISGTVTVTQGTGTNLHAVVDSGIITTITNVVHIDDNASSITVDNGGTFAVQSAQSGTWNIRNQDGYGVLLTASSTTPVGTETALITRNIPSGTQTVTGTVALSAGAAVIGHVIADTGSTTAVTGNVTVVQGTGTNLHTVIDSGTLTTLSTLTTITNVVHVDDNAGSLTVDNGGTFAVQAAQSGTWNIGTVTTLTGITNALPSGSNVIGHVIIDSGSTTAVTGTVTVTGAKTSNNAAPGATNVGTLPAVANAAAPSFVEGNQVALSTDLGGALRVSGSFSASTAATSTAADPAYVEGSTTSALSQTLTGQLRVLPAALVSDAPESYIDGTYKPLSVNAEGRLRVAMVPATTYMDFFGTDFNTAKTEDFTTLWDLSDSPWGPLTR